MGFAYGATGKLAKWHKVKDLHVLTKSCLSIVVSNGKIRGAETGGSRGAQTPLFHKVVYFIISANRPLHNESRLEAPEDVKGRGN